MKKIRWILLTAVLTVSLFLAACAHSDARSLVWYQEYPFEADIILDGYSVSMIKDGDSSTFTVNSPEALSGVSFGVNGNTVSVSYGDITVMLSPDAIENVKLMAGAFSLGQDRVKTVDNVPDGSQVTYSGEHTDYTVVYDRDGNPVSFEYTYNGTTKKAVIEKFSVDYGGNG